MEFCSKCHEWCLECPKKSEYFTKGKWCKKCHEGQQREAQEKRLQTAKARKIQEKEEENLFFSHVKVRKGDKKAEKAAKQMVEKARADRIAETLQKKLAKK